MALLIALMSHQDTTFTANGIGCEESCAGDNNAFFCGTFGKAMLIASPRHYLHSQRNRLRRIMWRRYKHILLCTFEMALLIALMRHLDTTFTANGIACAESREGDINAIFCWGIVRSPSRLLDSNIRDTLQHTATHCNTLQHTAIHCSTLQHAHHTATHCNTLQHAATHCNTLQHTATH